MRLFVYFILAAVAFIMIKAFVVDDYLANREKTDANVTEQSSAQAEAVEPAEAKEASTPKPDTNESELKKKRMSEGHEKMPLDKLGDEIADKIKL